MDKMYAETLKSMKKSFTRMIEIIQGNNSANLIERLAMLHYVTNRIDGENEVFSIAEHEFLCALILAYGDVSIDNEISFDIIDELTDLVKIYFINWSFNNTTRKMKNIEDGDLITRDKEYLLTSLATHYAMVRGDALFDQIIKEYNDLMHDFDDWLLKHLGFECDDINIIVNSIQTQMNERIKERNEYLKQEAKTILEEDIKLMKDPNFKHTRETRKFLRMIKSKKGQVEAEQRTFLMLEDKSYKGLLRFTIKDLVGDLDGTYSIRFEAFLNFFSISLNENVEISIKYPNDGNLFRDKPIIRTENDEYIFPCLSSLVWTIRAELEDQIKKDNKTWAVYQKKKSLYLELEVEKSFKKILPKSVIYNSLYYYTEENRQGRCELDSLILFDNNIFIVESKSGAYQKPAQRGAYGRLQENIKANIESAYKQAKRALDYIKKNSIVRFYDEKDNLVTEFEVDKYQRFYLINATLDNFSQLATRIDKLADIGLFMYKEFPWSVNIYDLRIIADFIEFPSQFIHYLNRRIKLNRINSNHVEIESSDELDYFGTYLDNGLYFDDENKFNKIQIANYAPYFNEYYMGKKYGHKVQKMTQTMGKDFKEIILNMERQAVFGYTIITNHFLDFSGELRKEFVELIDKTAQNAKMNIEKRCSDATFTTRNDPNVKSNGLGVTIFSGYSKDVESLRQKLEAFCQMKKYQQNAFEWIGLINFIDNPSNLFDELLYVVNEKEYDDVLENSMKLLTIKPILKRKIGRNVPCPCGSGKKYKSCCLPIME